MTKFKCIFGFAFYNPFSLAWIIKGKTKYVLTKFKCINKEDWVPKGKTARLITFNSVRIPILFDYTVGKVLPSSVY